MAGMAERREKVETWFDDEMKWNEMEWNGMGCCEPREKAREPKKIK